MIKEQMAAKVLGASKQVIAKSRLKQLLAKKLMLRNSLKQEVMFALRGIRNQTKDPIEVAKRFAVVKQNIIKKYAPKFKEIKIETSKFKKILQAEGIRLNETRILMEAYIEFLGGE